MLSKLFRATCPLLVCAFPVAAQEIVPSHAFSGEELTTEPAANWITNGGNTFNQRYSTLTRINRYNVTGLKAKWTTEMGSGDEFKNGGQTQILHYEGTLYVSNGVNDVFAIDAGSGEILWTYHGAPDPRSGNPIGWVSRGVAMGDGRIYLATIDAHLIALDQQTGREVWRIMAEDWQKGFSITSAPLYYNGLVVTGFSGGELGVRGRVKAFDADTGELVWTFYTVPAPGEFGSETWPQSGEYADAWQYGGAPVWQTPAFDPELGMIYFTTGNPGPGLHGGVRPGDNLFSVSMVALDAMTGEYRWHFQQVHHDLWDYDSLNPVVLFDAEIDGVERKGVVQVGKTGWAYILDRVTGEPLIGIEERPVPQEPRQATAATQPYPVGDAIVPQAIDIVPENTTVVNGGRIFTPFWTEPVAMKPGTMGGANWPPSSFDPESNTLFVCASDRISVFQVQAELNEPGDTVVYMGDRFTQAPVDDRGIFAALDVTTNTLKWRREWREICFNGSIATAGGILFVGRSDGRLTALDSRDGSQLWEFMTDAGINTTVTTFEHDGEQMVVVHAGGTAFAGSDRGDTIRAFSLEGAIDPITPEGGSGPAAPRAVSPDLALQADFDNGSTIYDNACAACHGETGEGGQGGGPALTGNLSLSQVMLVINDGRNTMPAFDVFTDQELVDISTFVTARLHR